MKLNDKQKELVETLIAEVGSMPTRKMIVDWFKRTSGAQFEGNRVPSGMNFPHFITNNKNIRVGRGAYDLMLLLNSGSSESKSGQEPVGTVETASAE